MNELPQLIYPWERAILNPVREIESGTPISKWKF